MDGLYSVIVFGKLETEQKTRGYMSSDGDYDSWIEKQDFVEMYVVSFSSKGERNKFIEPLSRNTFELFDHELGKESDSLRRKFKSYQSYN